MPVVYTIFSLENALIYVYEDGEKSLKAIHIII